MKKILLTLLAVSILTGVSAQTKKCGIDTKALVKEEIAQGATTVRMLAQVVPGYDRELLEKAGIVIGAEAGDVISLRVPVEALPLLESDGDVLYYSIAHTIGGMDCDKTRGDTRTDSVQRGLGVTDGLAFDGEGVYVGITDWGFDYTHPNIKSRIKRVWDHFRVAGPAPEGFDYGTVITGFNNVQNARGDTSNLYGYGTHGTHVAGICAGRGVDGGDGDFIGIVFTDHQEVGIGRIRSIGVDVEVGIIPAFGILDDFDPEYVVILSGDHIYKMDYGAMLRSHIELLPELLHLAGHGETPQEFPFHRARERP